MRLRGGLVAASYFGQFWWSFEALSYFRVQFSASAAYFSVVFLVRRSYIAVSAAAILLFLNLVPLFPYLGVAASAQAQGGGIGFRAITLNLHNEGADLNAVRRLIRPRSTILC